MFVFNVVIQYILGGIVLASRTCILDIGLKYDLLT